MVGVNYWKKIELDKEEEDRLHSVPDKTVRRLGYRYVLFQEDDPRNGWYRRIGIVPVDEETHERLRKEETILTVEEAEPWLRKAGR